MQQSPPKGPPPNLEDRLRNLILHNATPHDESPSQPQLQQHGTEDARQNTPRGGRKRPNQAQRRQMSSQLSIPIEPTTPQRQEFNAQTFHRPNNSFQINPAYQRHQHTYSQPHGGGSGGWRGRQPAESRGSWGGGEAQNQGTPQSAYIHTSNFQQRDAQFVQRERAFTGRGRYGGGQNQFYNRPQKHVFSAEEIANQGALLERLCFEAVTKSEIERPEIVEKEDFRQRIQEVCRHAIAAFEYDQTQDPNFPLHTVELKCFGSLSSGFATKASDMDLGLLSPFSTLQPDAPESPIPRLLEKALLDAGFGARLLSRTRVPIIKLCEHPPESLRHNLLAERAKWDKGITPDQDEAEDDGDDGDDDKDNDDNAPENSVLECIGEKSSSNDETSSAKVIYFEVPTVGGQTQRYHLYQGLKHSLPAYYGLAKRVLRKTGGRDATMSNYRDFKPLDWEVLSRVCQAFVEGLYDSKLRESLLAIPSMAVTDHHNVYRSLQGVYTQIEGEHMLQVWESSQVRKYFPSQESQAERLIQQWRDIQHNHHHGDDPLSYAKDLQLTMEKFQKLPILQLATLEQTAQETPFQYYNRTLAIVRSNGESDAASRAQLDAEIQSLYINGIHQEDFKHQIAALTKNSDEIPNFPAVGRKHMALQLGKDLTQALNGKYYSEEHTRDIQLYVELLLNTPFQPVSESVHALPVPDGLLNVIFRIQQLQDPQKMLPSQSRDRYHDALEFPKTGAGTQCDINFSAHLAMQNTLLLRCYSLTDPRVRPMVLFIKHWAKCRGINSGYRGTLSSYGYVLMVLHYLVNIAQPPVSPNLQHFAPPGSQPGDLNFPEAISLKGYNVQFWRNESEIVHLALNHQLTNNNQPLGHLLRGFFEYFAQNGILSTVPGKGFDWGRDVLSIRSQGGLLTKQAKGWTGAKTVYQTQQTGNGVDLPGSEPGSSNKAGLQPAKSDDVKEVRLRYLFAIEDPFELDHNVARTVTHNGIVSIRDEFRRAWRIIQAAGQGFPHDDLVQDVNAVDEDVNQFAQTISEIHGGTLI